MDFEISEPGPPNEEINTENIIPYLGWIYDDENHWKLKNKVHNAERQHPRIIEKIPAGCYVKNEI